MKPPFNLERFRLEIERSLVEIALRAITKPDDWIALVEEPQEWCRSMIDDEKDWSYRLDRGFDRTKQIPTYWIRDPDLAFHFKLRWIGV